MKQFTTRCTSGPRRTLLLLVLTLLPVALRAQGPAPLSDADKAGIAATAKAMGQAWAAHDIDTWGQYLTDDVQWINSYGTRWIGKPEVIRAHKYLHATIFKNFTTMHLIDISMAPLAPGVALVTTTSDHPDIQTSIGIMHKEDFSRFTTIYVKEGDHWLVRSAQNTPVLAAAQPHDPAKQPIPTR